MRCLKQNTLEAVARGLIPAGSSTELQAHLQACPACREAIARAARLRRDSPRPTDAPRPTDTPQPTDTPRPRQDARADPVPSPGAPSIVRWGSVIVAGLTLALCIFAASPEGDLLSRALDAVRHSARAGLSAVAHVPETQLWQDARATLRSAMAAREPTPEPVSPGLIGENRSEPTQHP